MENKLKKIKNRLEISVRYDDLDTYGHVNNKVYLSYLEEARIHYLNDVTGFMPSNLDFEAVVGRIDIKYTAPLFLNDETWVYTHCSRIGTKSYDLTSYIIKKVNEKEIVSAIAVVTMVSFDLKKGVTKPNNEKMIAKILEYENITPERKAI